MLELEAFSRSYMCVEGYFVRGEKGRKEDGRKGREKKPLFHNSPHSHMAFILLSYI